MWDACVSRAAVTVLYVEGLMLDPMCDTPHVQVTIVALQPSSKVAESVWLHTHAFSSKLRSSQHTGVRESTPRRSATHSLKPIVYE